MAELHVQLSISDPGLEGADRLVLSGVLHHVVQGSPPLNVLPESFVLLLDTMLQLRQTTRSLVRALEGLDEDSGQVIPAIYAAGRKLVEPSPSGSLEHQWQMLHGHVLVAAANLDHYSVIF